MDHAVREAGSSVCSCPVDSSRAALASLLLREFAFSDWECDRPTSRGMSVDSLGDILKMRGQIDALKVRWEAHRIRRLCAMRERGGRPHGRLRPEADTWRVMPRLDGA